MGRPQLNHFSITVHTDNNNRPDGLQYYDQEGCGHESAPFAMTAPLSELLNYHDNHRVRSHGGEERTERCRFEAVAGVSLTRCELDKHGRNVKHKVDLTW